jgi:hypothetical protein
VSEPEVTREAEPGSGWLTRSVAELVVSDRLGSAPVLLCSAREEGQSGSGRTSLQESIQLSSKCKYWSLGTLRQGCLQPYTPLHTTKGRIQ